MLQSEEIYKFFNKMAQIMPDFIKSYDHNSDISEKDQTMYNSTQFVEINYKKSTLPFYSILFGEHARELVSADLSVRFTQYLIHCMMYKKPNYLLENFRLIIIPNLNVSGRLMAENGNQSQRNNANEVDLNRNYDFKFSKNSQYRFGQSEGNNHPFSEYETRNVRWMLEEQKPLMHLSVHSGATSVMTVPAYKQPATNEEEALDEIVLKLSDEICDCRNGSVSKVLSYLSPGSNMDFAQYVEHVKYAYAFEIFGALDEDRNARDHFETYQGQFKNKLKESDFKDESGEFDYGKLLWWQRENQGLMKNEDTVEKQNTGKFFGSQEDQNPNDIHAYRQCMSNWTNAIEELGRITNEYNASAVKVNKLK